MARNVIVEIVKCVFLSIRKSLIAVFGLLLPIFFSIYVTVQGYITPHIIPYIIETLLSPLTITIVLILHEIGHYIVLPEKCRSSIVFKVCKGVCLMMVECSTSNIILSIATSLVLTLLLSIGLFFSRLYILFSLTLTSSIVLSLIDIFINTSLSNH
jgi:hypothetical protein